ASRFIARLGESEMGALLSPLRVTSPTGQRCESQRTQTRSRNGSEVMKTMTCIGTAATLAFIAASAAAAPSSRYVVSGATITQIADLGGAQSMALDINDDGYIA